MQPVLLGVGLEKGKELRLSLIAMSLGIRFRPVRESEYGLPLGELAGDPVPAGKQQNMSVDGEMIVMAHMTDKQTDALLHAIRTSGMQPIHLKAVLTPTNRSWSCGRLYQELKKEHFFLKGV